MNDLVSGDSAAFNRKEDDRAEKLGRAHQFSSGHLEFEIRLSSGVRPGNLIEDIEGGRKV